MSTTTLKIGDVILKDSTMTLITGVGASPGTWATVRMDTSIEQADAALQGGTVMHFVAAMAHLLKK